MDQQIHRCHKPEFCQPEMSGVWASVGCKLLGSAPFELCAGSLCRQKASDSDKVVLLQDGGSTLISSFGLVPQIRTDQLPGRSGPLLSGCGSWEHSRCSATAHSSTISGVVRVRTICRPCAAGSGMLGHLWSGIFGRGRTKSSNPREWQTADADRADSAEFTRFLAH